MVCLTRSLTSSDAPLSEKERQQGLASLAHLAGDRDLCDVLLAGEVLPRISFSGLSTDCEPFDAWSQTSSDDIGTAKDALSELVASSRDSGSKFISSGHIFDDRGPFGEALQIQWQGPLDDLLTTCDGHTSSEAQEWIDDPCSSLFCVACGSDPFVEPACSYHLKTVRPKWLCDVGTASLAVEQTPRDVDVPLPWFVGLDKQHSQWQGKAGDIGQAAPSTPMTTVMIRHIPCRYSQEESMRCLDEAGLGGRYDFVYLPLNASRRANLGYVFVNLVSAEAVEECRRIFTGQAFGATGSAKLCEVSFARIQGREMLKKRAGNASDGSRKRSANPPSL